MSTWTYEPSQHVPFRDTDAIRRVRAMTRDELVRHRNPDFRIHIMSASEIATVFLSDIFARIKESDEQDKPVVLILPNPCAAYREVAMYLNRARINCRNVHLFAMDEYANEKGQIAPETWEFGFLYALKKYFWANLDPELRMPEKQVHGPNNKNIDRYGAMMEDLGGADMCYSGPGWTGHLAFIEPDAPEFDAPLAEWKTFGARVCTLSPFTLAQNSLYGAFGKSGDLSIVPPKAATIGPREVIAAKNRLDMSSITVHGTTTSWQRLITRLAAHGPVTPKVPTSIHQELRTDFYISHENAMPIEPDWEKGY